MNKLLLVSAAVSLAIAAAAAAATGERKGGPLQEFIERSRSFASLPRHTHKPDFWFVPVEEKNYREHYSWIMDGGQKIGLLNLSFGEIEMFRFFPPANGVPVEYRMPEVHHWATLQGPRLTIVPQGTWSNRGEMAYVQDRGEWLRLRYSEKFGGNTQMVHQFALHFDPVLGYIWDCTFDMQMDRPERFEYANLLTGGLSESREDHKRYQKCIWPRRDGALCYMYQNPRSMMQGAGPAWTDVPGSSFVGWVAEKDMNPFVEILRTTPARFATCSQWYDQHIVAEPPEQKGDDGLYHIAAAYRMLSLPLPVAKELEDAARLMLPMGRPEAVAGFRQGIVNDFETSVPAGTLYNGCLWGYDARLDTTRGHSGTQSLRVGGGAEAQPIHGGTAIYVETAKRYRLGAWVRTRGVTGDGAFLRVNEVFWGWTDVRASHRSEALTGDNDWTRLEVEFTPVKGDPFAVPGLVVDGDGVAWFDDVELIELPP